MARIDNKVNSWVERLDDSVGLWKIGWTAVALAVVIILAFFFYLSSTQVLYTDDGFDVAQIARNIALGEGYSTHAIRPLNAFITDSAVPGRLPEINHAPLYPRVLCKWFQIRKIADDHSVLLLAMIFFAAGVVMTHFLATLLFDWKIGLMSAAVVGLSGTLLSMTLTGEMWPFVMCMFLAFCFAAVYYHKMIIRKGKKIPALIWCVILSLTVVGLYLTNYLFIWLIIPVLGFLWFSSRRILHPIIFIVVLAGCLFYPMMRNYEVCKSPILAGTAWDVLLDTEVYPELNAYRGVNDEIKDLKGVLDFPIKHFPAFAHKITDGIGKVATSCANDLISFIIICFAIVSALYKFRSPEVNALRGLMYAVFPILFTVFAAYSVSVNALIIFAPLLAIFASKYIALLLNAKKLHKIYSNAIVGGIMVIIALPLFMQIIWKTPQYSSTEEARSAEQYFTSIPRTGAKGVFYTDDYCRAAWSTSFSAVLLPLSDADIKRLKEIGMPIHVIVLTPKVKEYSTGEIWNMLYNIKVMTEIVNDRQKGLKIVRQEWGEWLTTQNITEQSKAAISKYLKTKFEDDYDRIMRQYAVYTELRGLRAQHAHPLQPEYIKVFFID